MGWLKLGIPILVGVAAAGLNWVALNDKAPAKTFVRLSENVTAGTPITADDLETIEISGTAEDLRQLELTAVPYDKRAVLIGRPALRDLKKNDFVFWRDVTSGRGELSQPALPIPLEGLNLPPSLLQVGDEILFLLPRPRGETGKANGPVEVGPFRILSVGDLVARQGADAKESRGQFDRTITIAVKLNKDRQIDDPNVTKLLAALRAAESERTRLQVILVPRSAAGK